MLSGNISILSSDDCLSAANSDLGSYDFSMNISGGTINAYSTAQTGTATVGGGMGGGMQHGTHPDGGDGFGRGDRPSADPPQKSTSKA